MTLRLSNNSLTRYVDRQGYAAAEPVPLDGPLGEVAASLLAWLSAQLAQGETLADVVIEPAGSVVTAYEQDEEGEAIPSEYRAVLSAAISVVAPLGGRTFIVSSESLPEDLRDGLLQNFEALTNG
jgi:hypothetical protein